jgi:TRAP-type mannitol/chloroaromatic compound transport system permease large subunit
MTFVELLPVFMFAALAILLFSGFPVAWVLGGVGIGFGFIGLYFGVFSFIEFFNVVSRLRAAP